MEWLSSRLPPWAMLVWSCWAALETVQNTLFLKKIIYLFIFGCVGSSFLCEGFLQLWRAGATLHRGARASHCHGLSRCGAQAPDVQAQQLWLTGLVAPWHVGSSQTRARTCVLSIGRQILNYCATREALEHTFKVMLSEGPGSCSIDPPVPILHG